MNELLAETDGGGGETPFGQGKPPTPDPRPHTISYFCGVAAGDFVDAQNPGTGRLAGAVNQVVQPRIRATGASGRQGEPGRLRRFPAVVERGSAAAPGHADRRTRQRWPSAPLTVTVRVEPDSATVDLLANRVTRQFVNGYLVDTVAETIEETVPSGGNVTLGSPGCGS